ncbi:MAG: hypothetical protein V3T17_07755 [Pseudomonadales bacterium]
MAQEKRPICDRTLKIMTGVLILFFLTLSMMDKPSSLGNIKDFIHCQVQAIHAIARMGNSKSGFTHSFFDEVSNDRVIFNYSTTMD